ncbi:hypothetical protein [Prochlorococcus marinus]|uniref:hypothetical protein n=1 Tax=Prochlorococcus marinus TaxID=1219 RepID=UPI00165084C9|nr:hypothetical protein [Prochlorococcus marinus]
MQISNNNNKFVLTNKKKAIIKERFAMKSILGIRIAGITSRLDNVYITLLRFDQENILLILI